MSKTFVKPKPIAWADIKGLPISAVNFYMELCFLYDHDWINLTDCKDASKDGFQQLQQAEMIEVFEEVVAA